MAPPLTMHPAVVALSLSEPASTASSSNAAMPRPPASPTDSPRPAVGGSSSSTRWGFGGHIPGLGTGVSARWLDPPVATATSLSPRLPAAATSASAAVGDLPEGHQHPSFAAASLRHLRSLPRVLWDSGVACSLSAALIFAVNALFVSVFGVWGSGGFWSRGSGLLRVQGNRVVGASAAFIFVVTSLFVCVFGVCGMGFGVHGSHRSGFRQ